MTKMIKNNLFSSSSKHVRYIYGDEKNVKKIDFDLAVIFFSRMAMLKIFESI